MLLMHAAEHSEHCLLAILMEICSIIQESDRFLGPQQSLMLYLPLRPQSSPLHQQLLFHKKLLEKDEVGMSSFCDGALQTVRLITLSICITEISGWELTTLAPKKMVKGGN